MNAAATWSASAIAMMRRSNVTGRPGCRREQEAAEGAPESRDDELDLLAGKAHRADAPAQLADDDVAAAFEARDARVALERRALERAVAQPEQPAQLRRRRVTTAMSGFSPPATSSAIACRFAMSLLPVRAAWRWRRVRIASSPTTTPTTSSSTAVTTSSWVLIVNE